MEKIWFVMNLRVLLSEDRKERSREVMETNASASLKATGSPPDHDCKCEYEKIADHGELDVACGFGEHYPSSCSHCFFSLAICSRRTSTIDLFGFGEPLR